MINENCIFCKLANGVIPTNTVFEDEDFRVIMDASPAAKGHSLVLMKEHYENALSADEELFGKAMILAARVGKSVKNALGCDGINILQNNGAAAGQTVFHLHIHVIPRWDDDGLALTWKPGEDTQENIAAIAKLISENMK